MAAPYNSLSTKVEKAFQAVIIAAATGIPDDQVFIAFQSGYDTPVGPVSVGISCEGGIEDGFGSGNYRLSVRVVVSSTLDQDVTDEGSTEAETHQSYVGKVFDALCTTDIADSLTSAVDDFKAYGSINRRIGRNRVENRKAVAEMMLELSCAPSDIT